jgi:hypothetical protein
MDIFTYLRLLGLQLIDLVHCAPVAGEVFTVYRIPGIGLGCSLFDRRRTGVSSGPYFVLRR